MSNYTFGKLIVTKKEFANILLLANVFLGADTLSNCMGTFPGKEGRIQMLVGLAKQ